MRYWRWSETLFIFFFIDHKKLSSFLLLWLRWFMNIRFPFWFFLPFIINSIKAIRQSGLRWCLKPCNEHWRHSLSLSKLRNLSSSHKSLLHLLILVLSRLLISALIMLHWWVFLFVRIWLIRLLLFPWVLILRRLHHLLNLCEKRRHWLRSIVL